MHLPKRPDQRIFDLYLLPSRWGATYNEDNRGVSLTDESIAWISEGKAETAPLKSVVSVRLQFTPQMEGQRSFRACRIHFDDGRRLSVTDWYGFHSNDTAPDYRAFVHDLHNRLMAYGAPSIRYLAGDDPLLSRLKIAFFAAAFLVVSFFVLSPPLTLISAVKILLLMALFGLVWLWDRFFTKSRPREYQPTDLPEELIVGK